MKLSWRTELPQWIVIAAMFAVAAWAWPQVPDQIPIHWNIHGEVDGYGGKFIGLLLLPMIVAGIYCLMIVVPLVDPGRGNYANFSRAFNVIRMALVFFMAAIYGAAVVAAFGRPVDMTTVACLGCAAMFMFIGNFMGKIRPNWFVGVRTPWTLSSKMSWNKTHRLAGWLFIVMGLLFAVVGIVRTVWASALMVAIDVACLIWMIIYSYLVYRHDPERTSPAGVKPGSE